MNPLVTNQTNANPMMQLVTMLQNGANPMALAQQVIQNDPGLAQRINQMKMACGSNNPKDFILNWCNQNGMDPNPIIQIAGMYGLK